MTVQPFDLMDARVKGPPWNLADQTNHTAISLTGRFSPMAPSESLRARIEFLASATTITAGVRSDYLRSLALGSAMPMAKWLQRAGPSPPRLPEGSDLHNALRIRAGRGKTRFFAISLE